MDQLLNPAEAARFLGVSVNTLAAWRVNRRYPLTWIRVGNRVRYRQADLERFVAARSQHVQPTAA